MNKSGNDIESPENNIFGDSMSEEEFLRKENGNVDDLKPEASSFDALIGAIFLSRPLGILFDEDLIEDFLQSRGYKIVERTDEDGEVYSVPVKIGSKIIPDRKNSLRRIFDREVQEILISWMKTIKK